MAEMYQPPPELQGMPPRGGPQKKFFDVNAPGPGTPWERRGEFGVASAFLKTATRAMTSPFRVTDAIRRAETVNEVKSFALACGALWAAAVLIYNAVMYYRYGASTDPRTSVDPTYFWVAALVQAAAAVVLTWVLTTFAAGLFGKVVAGELKTVAPSLLVNVFGYCLGASLIAPLAALVGGFLTPLGAYEQFAPATVWPVPLWPAVPVLWILASLAIATQRRLNISGGNALIGCVISVGLAAAIGVAAYVVVGVAWNLSTGGAVTFETPEKPATAAGRT